MREVFYFGNRIVTDIQRGELRLTNTIDRTLARHVEQSQYLVTNVLLKILQSLDTVVTEVQFLQTLQSFEIFDFSDAVRLQRKDPETSQTAKVLTVIVSINVTAIGETPPRVS